MFTDTQTHNFCTVGNEDWLQFEAAADESYLIGIAPLHNSTATHIELCTSEVINDAPGITVTLVAEAKPQKVGEPGASTTDAFGQGTALPWTAEADGTVFLRLRYLEPLVAGNAVQYRTSFFQYGIYLPAIFR